MAIPPMKTCCLPHHVERETESFRRVAFDGVTISAVYFQCFLCMERKSINDVAISVYRPWQSASLEC